MNYGGKANSLMKLRANHYNVPSFFIIPSEYYKKFLEENNLYDRIIQNIQEGNYETIKKDILNATVSDELFYYIEEEYEKLGAITVSVRSSAANEDGDTKSFAGQYDTYLNVEKKDLIEKIKLCWCSLYTNNIISYQADIDILGMNVIVQTMIHADYAGVAFSVDPTSDTFHYSVIEVVKGIGESLVSGKTTPTKFLVRRETHSIDLKIGAENIDENIIKQLEIIVLEIEKLFGKPVDVEYAIKNNQIYLLQSRPITAFTQVTRPFELSITRPSSLMEESIYYKGEYEGIKQITKDLYYYKPLFVYNSNHKNTDIYYNLLDLEEDPTNMYRFIDDNYDDFSRTYQTVKKYIHYIDDIIDSKKNFDIADIVDKLVMIFPFASLGQLAGHFDGISLKLKNLLFDFRNHYDYIVHKTCDYLLDYLSDKLPDTIKPYSKFITVEEYRSEKIPELDVLVQRSKGYIYYDNQVSTDYLEKWLKENNISIVKQENEVFTKGTVVYGNRNITGKVTKIFSEKDFQKFHEQDILVTPMTTPKFMAVIKKAKAIVTDEGGITCHAAIISRELQIPCIIGCKNITKALNDGDEININISTGEITIHGTKME